MTSPVANTNLTSQIFKIESLEGLLARNSESLAMDSDQLSIRPALMVLQPAKGPLRLYWEISLTITAFSQLLSSNTSSSEKLTMLETCLASLLNQRAQLQDILNQHSSSQRIKNSIKINKINRQLCNQLIDYLKDPNHPSENIQKILLLEQPEEFRLISKPKYSELPQSLNYQGHPLLPDVTASENYVHFGDELTPDQQRSTRLKSRILDLELGDRINITNHDDEISNTLQQAIEHASSIKDGLWESFCLGKIKDETRFHKKYRILCSTHFMLYAGRMHHIAKWQHPQVIKDYLERNGKSLPCKVLCRFSDDGNRSAHYYSIHTRDMLKSVFPKHVSTGNITLFLDGNSKIIADNLKWIFNIYTSGQRDSLPALPSFHFTQLKKWSECVDQHEYYQQFSDYKNDKLPEALLLKDSQTFASSAFCQSSINPIDTQEKAEVLGRFELIRPFYKYDEIEKMWQRFATLDSDDKKAVAISNFLAQSDEPLLVLLGVFFRGKVAVKKTGEAISNVFTTIKNLFKEYHTISGRITIVKLNTDQIMVISTLMHDTAIGYIDLTQDNQVTRLVGELIKAGNQSINWLSETKDNAKALLSDLGYNPDTILPTPQTDSDSNHVMFRNCAFDNEAWEVKNESVLVNLNPIAALTLNSLPGIPIKGIPTSYETLYDCVEDEAREVMLYNANIYKAFLKDSEWWEKLPSFVPFFDLFNALVNDPSYEFDLSSEIDGILFDVFDLIVTAVCIGIPITKLATAGKVAFRSSVRLHITKGLKGNALKRAVTRDMLKIAMPVVKNTTRELFEFLVVPLPSLNSAPKRMRTSNLYSDPSRARYASSTRYELDLGSNRENPFKTLEQKHTLKSHFIQEDLIKELISKGSSIPNRGACQQISALWVNEKLTKKVFGRTQFPALKHKPVQESKRAKKLFERASELQEAERKNNLYKPEDSLDSLKLEYDPPISIVSKSPSKPNITDQQRCVNSLVGGISRRATQGDLPVGFTLSYDLTGSEVGHSVGFLLDKKRGLSFFDPNSGEYLLKVSDGSKGIDSDKLTEFFNDYFDCLQKKWPDYVPIKFDKVIMIPVRKGGARVTSSNPLVRHSSNRYELSTPLSRPHANIHQEGGIVTERSRTSVVEQGSLGGVRQLNRPVPAVKSSRGDYIFSNTQMGSKDIIISGNSRSSILDHLNSNGTQRITNEIDKGEIYVGWTKVPSSTNKVLNPIGDSAKATINGTTNLAVRVGGIPSPDIAGTGLSPGGLAKPAAGGGARLRMIKKWRGDQKANYINSRAALGISYMPQDGFVEIGKGSVTYAEIANKMNQL
ncbi:hypothetical protein GTG28_08780 [Vibrio sp. OCN044]|uniref:Uncharacterized protein n=1 Tax=Vibrio tetraodonis subsp. pristinus TaxID=2695891 RepID=A0A6L8LTC2_9VIBR|nr:hypothetical protein [Vibrio tetraodonis]MYM59318.1 hypothetical protein [Vibrio tetraodonis subsp. pristinus]